jgi:hypothetical protein
VVSELATGWRIELRVLLLLNRCRLLVVCMFVKLYLLASTAGAAKSKAAGGRSSVAEADRPTSL